VKRESFIRWRTALRDPEIVKEAIGISPHSALSDSNGVSLNISSG